MIIAQMYYFVSWEDRTLKPVCATFYNIYTRGSTAVSQVLLWFGVKYGPDKPNWFLTQCTTWFQLPQWKGYLSAGYSPIINTSVIFPRMATCYKRNRVVMVSSISKPQPAEFSDFADLHKTKSTTTLEKNENIHHSKKTIFQGGSCFISQAELL